MKVLDTERLSLRHLELDDAPFILQPALAVRNHATDSLGIRRLLAITSPVNAASARLLRKLGFVAQGQMPWAGDDRDS